jgi:hypothetical protein
MISLLRNERRKKIPQGNFLFPCGAVTILFGTFSLYTMSTISPEAVNVDTELQSAIANHNPLHGGAFAQTWQFAHETAQA